VLTFKKKKFYICSDVSHTHTSHIGVVLKACIGRKLNHRLLVNVLEVGLQGFATAKGPD
jgi:hypothetical protein